MRYRFLRAAAGNSAAAGTSGAWGMWALNVTNPKIVFDTYNDAILLDGGYNRIVSVERDGSGIKWSKDYSGLTLTHTTRGTDNPSFGGIRSGHRPLILSSNRAVCYKSGTWLYTNPYLFLYFNLYHTINLSTGAHVSTFLPNQEADFDSATSSMYLLIYGMCQDSSGNYAICYESADKWFMQGYNSSGTLQWTIAQSSTYDGYQPMVNNIGSNTLIPMIGYNKRKYCYINMSTGAKTTWRQELSASGTTSLIANTFHTLGYDSNGHIAYVNNRLAESDTSTSATQSPVITRLNASTGAVEGTSVQMTYKPESAQSNIGPEFAMDSSDNVYFMCNDRNEVNQTTPEWGPKMIKVAPDGTVEWERVLTSDYTTTSTSASCTTYDIAVSGDSDADDPFFFVTVRIRHTSPYGYSYFFAALPRDGTETTLTDGSYTFEFKALDDGNSRFAVNTYTGYSNTGTNAVTANSTQTTPTNYTSNVSSFSDSDGSTSYSAFS